MSLILANLPILRFSLFFISANKSMGVPFFIIKMKILPVLIYQIRLISKYSDDKSVANICRFTVLIGIYWYNKVIMHFVL